MREFKINGVEIPIDIPVCHREMYAEWVERGRPQMELQTQAGPWVCVGNDPGWNSDIEYRFKDSPLDEKSKAMRHLLDEMPIAKEFKASSEEHDAGLPTSALQTQVGGDHYAKMKIQPVEFIHANNLNFIEGSIVKYVARHRAKNGKQDLEKAKHFLEMLIELEYGDEG
jgi:hypothetical protein